MTPATTQSQAARTGRAVPTQRAFDPLQIVQIELACPLPSISAALATDGYPYRRALALVRLHTQPIGLVELTLGPQGLAASACAEQIWGGLGSTINKHLYAAGAPAIGGLDASGIALAGVSSVDQARRQRLENPPFVSVVVATRNRPAQLLRCLRSLLALDYPSYEIIVVDNAPSSDASARAIREQLGNAPRIRYLVEEQAGSAWARNRGLSAARSDIVAFTDDDVLVDAHWLSGLVAGFAEAENVACVTGMILPLELETRAQLWLEEYGGYSKGFRQRVFDHSDAHERGRLYPYTAGVFGSGANMALKNSVARGLGIFDPALGAGTLAYGGEDLDAYFQVVMHGYRLVYQPGALVFHPHYREFAQLHRQMFGYGAGLTAFLTKCISDDPWRILDLAKNVFYGLSYMLSPGSPKNRRKRHDYPSALTRNELRGMLYGPIGYFRSRRRVRARLSQHSRRQTLVGSIVDSESPLPKE